MEDDYNYENFFVIILFRFLRWKDDFVVNC